MVIKIARKTQEQFVQELKNVNPNITVIGKYINTRTPILCKCNICNYVFTPTPTNLLNGHGCASCAGLKKKTHKEFIEQLNKISNTVVVLSTYVNDGTKVKCQCKICGNTFEQTPNHLLKGVKCPVCSKKQMGLNKRKTHQDFVKELNKINQDIELLSEYTRSTDKITVRCKLCGRIYNIIANNLLRGNCCTCCHMSRGERKIRDFLQSNKIEYIFQYKFQDCRNSKPLPFDFYLPLLNTCIEYDGYQHFFPSGFGCHDDEKIEKNFKATIKNDNIKNNYCIENRINLIRIPYTEFDNIERFLEEKL